MTLRWTIALLCASGCSTAHRADWSIAFGEGITERTGTQFEVRLTTSCGSLETLGRWIVDHETPIDTYDVAREQAAIEVTAIDSECRAYAFGCAAIDRQATQFRVQLMPLEPSDRCGSSACTQIARCAGDDGGTDGSIEIRVDAGDSGEDSDGSMPVDGGSGCSPSCRYGCTDVGACAFPRNCSTAEATEPGPARVRRIDPVGGAPLDVYCAGDGWTLVAKIDGTDDDFVYDSPLWTDDEFVNEESRDLSRAQAKLAAFGAVPFREVRLDFEYSGQRGSIVAPVAAASMRALFAGSMRTTSLGRNAWIAAMPTSGLQPSCNLEGANIVAGFHAARLGILANNEANCDTTDSAIGIGLRHHDYCGGRFDGSAGAYWLCEGEGTVRSRPAFVWVFVR